MLRQWVFLAALTLALLIAGTGCGTSAETADSAATPVPPSKPRQEWRSPTGNTATDRGFEIACLGSQVMTTGYDDKASRSKPAPSLDYAVAYLVVADTTGAGRAATPAFASTGVTDSVGGSYDVTYTELFDGEGLSVGAVSYRGSPTGRKIYRLSIDALAARVGKDPPAKISGVWRLDLLEQVSDVLEPHRHTAGPSRNPFELDGRKVTLLLAGLASGGDAASSITVEGLKGGPVAVHWVVSRSDGAVQAVDKAEYDLLTAPVTPVR